MGSNSLLREGLIPCVNKTTEIVVCFYCSGEVGTTGVEVEFSLTSIGNDGEADLLEIINKALQSGSLGGLVVDTEPVTLESAPPQPGEL